MGIKQILLDVDKARELPEIIDISAAIERVPCVEGLSIVVNEIDNPHHMVAFSESSFCNRCLRRVHLFLF